MLPGPCARHRQFAVVAALPVQQQADPLALPRRPLMLPGPLQVRAQGQIRLPLRRCQRLLPLLRLQPHQPLLTGPLRLQAPLPELLQIAPHVRIVQLHIVKLQPRPLRPVARFLQRLLCQPLGRLRCLPTLVPRLQRRFHAQRLQRLQHGRADHRVRPHRPEAETVPRVAVGRAPALIADRLAVIAHLHPARAMAAAQQAGQQRPPLACRAAHPRPVRLDQCLKCAVPRYAL